MTRIEEDCAAATTSLCSRF